MPAKSIERVLSEVEIARLAGAVETLTNLGASIQAIKAATTEHVGFENAVELPKLAKLVAEMTEFVRAALVKRDPSLAPPPEAPGAGEGALQRRRLRRRPRSPRASRLTPRLLPHSATLPPPSRQVRRFSSSGRRAKRWGRTCTR